jgi:hypothetical protein
MFFDSRWDASMQAVYATTAEQLNQLSAIFSTRSPRHIERFLAHGAAMISSA